MNDSQLELDPYEVLNVNYDASLLEIREAFKKLVLMHHPDRGGNPRSFQLIKGAYSYIFKELKKEEELQKKKQRTLKTYRQQRQQQNQKHFENTKQERESPIVSAKDFNINNFNRLYDNYRVEDADDHGYGTYMEQNGQVRSEDINQIKNSQLKRFDKQTMIIYEEPESMRPTDSFDTIGKDKTGDFTSGFNINDKKKKIAYTDYMRAHSEAEQISSNTPNVRQGDYKSVDQLRQQRGNISYELSDQDRIRLEKREREKQRKEKLRKLRQHQKEQEIEAKFQQRQQFIRFN
jgi:curved DNA-binding protein CbpA